MGGGGDQKQSENQTVTPYQQDYYDKLLSRAGQTFDSAGGFYDPLYGGGGETRAGQTDEQAALAAQLSGISGVGADVLAQTLGSYDPNNPALTAAIDMASGDVTRNLQENLLPSIGDAATGAGQFGSSRQGVAEGIALRGASEQIGDIATQMRLQDLQQFQGSQQAALTNLGGLTQGLEFGASGTQREEQAMLDDLFAKWEYESGVDLQDMLAYKGLISGDMGGESKAKAGGGGGK